MNAYRKENDKPCFAQKAYLRTAAAPNKARTHSINSSIALGKYQQFEKPYHVFAKDPEGRS